MKCKSRLLIILCVFYASLTTAQSNLYLDTTLTIEEMVEDFFNNPNITLSDITFSGDSISYAFFDAGDTDLGLDAGILFTTGSAMVAASSAPGNKGKNNEGGSDEDLNLLSGGWGINDAAIVEFDLFIENSDVLSFNYIFASEEYPEWVCSNFNDVFGFFISGPGIFGPYTNDAINITTVPGPVSEVIVAVNTINDSISCGPPGMTQYYIDNYSGTDIEYDGLTTALPAYFYAEGGVTYHVKLAIADVGDSIFDSGVFLSFKSLGSDSLLVPPAEFDFVSNGLEVQFENLSKYAKEWHWDFGNGMTSDERYPSAVSYSTSGIYTISLTTQNFCCSDTFSTTIEVDELIELGVDFTIENNPVSCFGDKTASISAEIFGGSPPYNIVWEPEIDNINQVGANTYSYIITDGNNEVINGDLLITQPEELVLELNSTPAVANQTGGAAVVVANGGTAPYSYIWSNDETEPTLENLNAGLYMVTVADVNGCTSVGEVTVDLLTNTTSGRSLHELLLSPNPVEDVLFISNIKNRNLAQINIYDLAGRKVDLEYELGPNEIKIKLISVLAPGVYFVEVQWTNGTNATGRFIKS